MGDNNRGNNKGNNSSTDIAAPQKITGQRSKELQAYGTLVKLPIALEGKACLVSIINLNQLIADTMALRDLYKKHHWQVSGSTFNQLHLLFDKHSTEQSVLVDIIAERIQTLGGVSLAMAADAAETTIIPRAPRGREQAQAQLSRLLQAHEMLLKETRAMARQASENNDEGTNDLLVSDVIRTNELQVWFVSQHLTEEPVVTSSPW